MKPRLIDTHTHLYFQQYEGDLRHVLIRAEEAGVGHMITIGIDADTSRHSLELTESHSQIYAAAGIHPHDAVDIKEGDIEQISEMLDHPKVVAIGEVGLDFYRNISPPDLQKQIFKMFMEWSLERQLPMIIHTRQAEEDIITVLRDRCKQGWKGVFHCFPGDADMAKTVLDMGFYISFTGNITFKNSKAAAVVETVPLDRLMVETDCPFLTPVPYRGKRNEPAYVSLVARKMAEIKGVAYESVVETTTKNAIDLFNLPIPDDHTTV
jgi:TatD DNase family protein